jgi:hypothetical protein
MTKAHRRLTPEAKMRQAVVRAEQKSVAESKGKESHDPGTGFTILRLASKPIAHLIKTKKIGQDEVRAAEEICTAFFALSGGLMFRPQQLERRDPTTRRADLPPRIASAVDRYGVWADHWSRRRKLGDPTLEIVVAAVVDERSMRSIAEDVGYRFDRIRSAIVCGLRDYASRAGWIDPRLAAKWEDDAARVFRVEAPDIRLAKAAARAARDAGFSPAS